MRAVIGYVVVIWMLPVAAGIATVYGFSRGLLWALAPVPEPWSRLLLLMGLLFLAIPVGISAGYLVSLVVRTILERLVD